MSWRSYFDRIYLVSLPERKDRLEASTKILNDLKVDFELVPAIKHEKGYLGLVETMQKLFKEALDKGFSKILVLEDDICPLESNEVTNETLDKCIEQLPNDWDLFYMGCNCAGGLRKFYSENLLPVTHAFTTHSLAYSQRAMQAVVNANVREPIDNYLMREIQPKGASYCSNPMIFTQCKSYSDIEERETDYSRFLETRFNAEIKKLKQEL